MILTNVMAVLPDAVCHGTLVVEGGAIVAIDETRARYPGAIECEGEYLLPGIVDLHTDNLERQVLPRANARWPARSALLAHDQHCAGGGVTTVLDALCLGDLGFEKSRNQTFIDGIAALDALEGTGLLKAEHFLHLRCELPAEETLGLLRPVAHHQRVRLVSLMDHTPGIGQHADLDRYRALRRSEGCDAATIEHRIRVGQEDRARLRSSTRAAILAIYAGTGVALASHDDRTEAEIAENAADGIRISEFPVTAAAARAARQAGMQVVVGAPNIVRGGSHSGNVDALALVRAGLVDALASDYVPASLIEAAFTLAARGAVALTVAIAAITAIPSGMVGLADRGCLQVGRRADLVRVRVHDGLPVVRAVWRAGERVA